MRDRQVAGDRARRVGDDRLDAADVVRESALDLARARLGEEAQRHALEVGVERAAQVLHHVLADDVVEVALADPDQAGDDRQRDHQPDVEVEVVVVLADDDLVDQQPEEQGIDQADEAGRQDRHEHDHDLELVRPEEVDDPAQGLGLALLRDRGEFGHRAAEVTAVTTAATAHRRGRAALAAVPPPPRPPPAAPPVAARIPPRGNPIRLPIPS